MDTVTDGKPLTMAEQVRAANEAARNTAKTGEGGSVESTEIEATSEDPGVTPASDALGEGLENQLAVDPPAEEETLIRIGDKTFKTEREALAYAEQAERDRLVEQAHTLGVREALEALKPQTAAAPVEEEDFDTKFYADPKTALKTVREQATQDALALMRAENAREQQWVSFLNDNPDIDRQDAERILQANWNTIGKMTVESGRKELARAVRADYQRIAERLKPRTELSNRGSQAVSAGRATQARGVTPPREEKPVDFITQMKKLKSHS